MQPRDVHRFIVLAIDRRTGRIKWERTAQEERPRAPSMKDGTWASSSAITDGSRVFAFFESSGLYVYNMDGSLLWQKHFGDKQMFAEVGESGSTPVLYGDCLVVVWDHQGKSFIVALDARTGAELWRTDYGDAETAPTVCGIPTGTKQYGFVKSVTGPSPALGSTVVTEYAYDVWGRTVGTKVSGDTAWSCTSFDTRGRVTQQTITGPTGTTTRTVTTTYMATTTGVRVATADGTVAGSPNGSTVTTETDLLGRATKYTDVWNAVTVNTYGNLTGRLTATATTPAGGSATTTEYTYDLDGKVLEVKTAGQVMASPTYDTFQQLASVTYLGGSKLNSVTRDPAGRTTGQQWTFPSATTITDQVTRSQSGRIVQHATTRGSTVTTAKYGYDTAGRLITATIPGHQLTYQFAGTGGCGANTAAGVSGNRTGLIDVYTAPGQAAVTTSTAYCYDWADRLTGSTVTNPVTGANTVADGITPAEIGYDARGNITRLADMVLTYDSGNRHSGTTYNDGTIVTLARDATGRVVSRTVDPAGRRPRSPPRTCTPAGPMPRGGSRPGTTHPAGHPPRRRHRLLDRGRRTRSRTRRCRATP